MHFFKSGLMILSLAVLLTPDNSSSSHTECLASVNIEKMNVSSDGFQMYLSFVFDVYGKIQNSIENIPDYDSKMKIQRFKCVHSPSVFEAENENKSFKNVLQYICDIVVNDIYDTEIQNAEQWCEIYSIDSAFFSDHKDPETKKKGCVEILHKAKFNFKHGIDNYASLLSQYGRGDNAQETYLSRFWSLKTPDEIHFEKLDDPEHFNLTSTSGGGHVVIMHYSRYLKHEAPEQLYKIESMQEWCLDYDCEDELKNAGFTNRFKGSVNYKIIRSNYNMKCNEIESNLGKDYCIYLMHVDKIEINDDKTDEGVILEIDSKSIDKGLGTRGYCKKIRKNQTDTTDTKEENKVTRMVNRR